LLKKIRLSDTLEVYREVFTLDMYRKEGIEVSDGDCVFDVGANIGLFLIALARTNRNLKIFAFEPIPSTFQMLELNCKDHLSGSEVKLFPVGIADSCRVQDMCFDGFLSAGSTLYIDQIDGAVSLKTKPRVWVKALITDLHDTGMMKDLSFSRLTRGIDNPFSRPFILAPFCAAIGIGALVRRARLRKIPCQLKTLSTVIRETGTERIDLLKVDVEGAELDVVRGIQPDDFKKIRQIAIEVHDFEAHLQKITDILKINGFSTSVRPGDWKIHKLLNIYTVYGKR
jgi:hypothetical protein